MLRFFVCVLVAMGFNPIPLPPMAYLIIPKIALVEDIEVAPLVGTSWDTGGLNYGVGRLEGLGWYTVEGQTARVVIVGHSPGAFTYLRNLKQGDLIIINPGVGANYSYQVFAVYLTGVEDLGPVSGIESPVITLITCYGDNQRLVINAR